MPGSEGICGSMWPRRRSHESIRRRSPSEAGRPAPADVAIPEPGEDEVLVEVHAAGVNMLDAKIRGGEFKLLLPYRLPLILGHEVAGVVVKVGTRVRRFKPGDEVYARMIPGSGRSPNSSRQGGVARARCDDGHDQCR